jgi:arsenate reductase (thioredoxin)
MKLLFICTHNRCRSILSEAITQQAGGGWLEARSAGSQPAGEVHPLSLRYLAEAGYSTQGLRSQSWDDFADYKPDAVITVCASAAAEVCPVWMGPEITWHWGLEDPSKLQGSEAEVAQAFRDCIALIENRTQALVELARQQLPQAQWTLALRALVETVA